MLLDQSQASVIAVYAEAHGYEISRTYFDPGKSGLTLTQRKGLTVSSRGVEG